MTLTFPTKLSLTCVDLSLSYVSLRMYIFRGTCPVVTGALVRRDGAPV